MDSPPSKKGKGDTSPTPSNQPEKGDNHTGAFKLDKSESFKSKKKGKV